MFHKQQSPSLRGFADRTGLEPATSAVTGRHSNQLNYRSVPPTGTNHPVFRTAKIGGRGCSNKSFQKKIATPNFTILTESYAAIPQ